MAEHNQRGVGKNFGLHAVKLAELADGRKMRDTKLLIETF
jgi:hypothetical protein